MEEKKKASEAHMRATAKWEKQNYDKVLVRFPKGTKDKITECLIKNNLKFNNLDRTEMQISVTVESTDINPTIHCLHELFFKK